MKNWSPSVKLKLMIILILIPIQSQALSINQWIDLYLRDCETVKINQACKQDLELNFGRMYAYRSLTFKYLDKNGLPRWLATVPIVESSYNDRAVSPKNALGLWQIMSYNIKKYRTKTKTILNRSVTIVPTKSQIRKYGFNPVTSTQIATEHLKKLYLKYREYRNTEELALMAYNAGERRIYLWLSGKGKLPDETLNYYRKLMAIQFILKNMKPLKIKPVKQRRIFIFDYIKALTKLEIESERDTIHSEIKRILG